MVPGTVDTGNHCDDCVTAIPLPFPYQLYDQVFTSVNLSSNGNAQFVGTHSDFVNLCLPVTTGTWTYTIFPYWDDLMTNGTGLGIFTTVEGTAPNRILDIEWRANYFPGNGTANFELRLYEGQQRFDVVFGTLTNGNTSATDGVQKDATNYTQYFCNGTGGPAVGSVTYTLGSCGTATATAQVSATRTTVATSTATVRATSTNVLTSTATIQATGTARPSATNTTVLTSTATVRATATRTAIASVTAATTATAFACNGRVTICHRTGNGGHHTITVSCNALPAHLAHGDTIGPCPVGTPGGTE